MLYVLFPAPLISSFFALFCVLPFGASFALKTKGRKGVAVVATTEAKMEAAAAPAEATVASERWAWCSVPRI